MTNKAAAVGMENGTIHARAVMDEYLAHGVIHVTDTVFPAL